MKIQNCLNTKEYNSLRNFVGWDSKEQYIIERAIANSVIMKRVIIDNETIGMARFIGDGIYYLIADVVINPKYQKKVLEKN